MTPATERLVRLMVLLPDHSDPLWDRVTEDCGDLSEVMSMRWHVGEAAQMWPPAGPRNLANAVLVSFGSPSQATLGLISKHLAPEAGQGTGPGAAWVAQACAAAIDVIAEDLSLEDLRQEVEQHWTLNPNR